MKRLWLALQVAAYCTVFFIICAIVAIPCLFLTLGRGRKWSDGV